MGGNFQNLGVVGLLEGGGFDQRGRKDLSLCADTLPLAARRDVLVFRTEALTEGVEVTGPLLVRLWIASSAVDTDFTAKLVDEYPPSEDYPEGFALNIADSITRVRYRGSRERAELMPGRVYEITIEPQATSNYFGGAPHPPRRVQQQLSALRRQSQYGRAARSERRRWRTRACTDGGAASHIVLPVIPAQRTKEPTP